MMIFFRLLLLTGLQLAVFYAAAQTIAAPGQTLTQAGEGFAFTEGPAVDKKGNVFFTDQPNNRIWKYDLTGKLSVFMEPAGRSNGMYFDKKGNLVACADEKNELWQIAPNKSVKKLVLNYKDSVLNGPNDVWIAPGGNIYFTDPYYQRDYWTRKAPEIKEQALYLYKTDGTLVRLDSEFKKPNGLIGSPDGKTLYVADIGDNKIYKYTIQQDGSLTNKLEFIPQGCDGMTIDSEGNIYLAGRGVTVYNNKGEKIDQIDVPAGWTANICFAGKNRDTLFITASDKIFTLKTRTRGVQ